MAFKRTLAQRFFSISKFSSPALYECRVSSSPAAVKSSIPPNPARIAPDPGDEVMFRRFIQQRPIYQSAGASPELRSLPTGEKLLEKLRVMDIARDRLRLDGLTPPAVRSETPEGKLTVEDARKLLRISQIETVKSKLNQIPKSCIPYAEFVQICSDCSLDRDQGLEFAKTLDESGTVVVLGDYVFLRPDQEIETLLRQVVKAIRGLVPEPVLHPNDPRRKEFEELEKQKSCIDQKAESLVRRELWCGLGYLVVQTAAFMRLTFWELTWDVMEPICFYVTSVYFMAGYAFFLRTSKEPSFEGFFQSRFSAKQKKLMKIHNFDVVRYNELRRAIDPHPSTSSSSSEQDLASIASFNLERSS